MDWKSKLTSRKFWTCIINLVTQIMILFRASDSEVTQVAAIIMAGAGVIAYIIGEGMADAAGAKSMEVYVPDDEDEYEPPDEVG